MSADIVAEIARVKMGRLQIVAVSVCVLLNMLDGFHVLVMSLYGARSRGGLGPLTRVAGYPLQRRFGGDGCRLPFPGALCR